MDFWSWAPFPGPRRPSPGRPPSVPFCPISGQPPLLTALPSPAHPRLLTVYTPSPHRSTSDSLSEVLRWGDGGQTVERAGNEPEVAAGAWLGPVSPKRGFAWVDKGYFRAFSAFFSRAGHSQALVSSMTPLCHFGSVWERMPGWPLGAPERAGREQVESR